MTSPGRSEKLALTARGSPSRAAHTDRKQKVLMTPRWELRPRRSGKRKVRLLKYKPPWQALTFNQAAFPVCSTTVCDVGSYRGLRIIFNPPGQWFLRCGVCTSSSSWKHIRNANSQVYPRPTESEILKVEPGCLHVITSSG